MLEASAEHCEEIREQLLDLPGDDETSHLHTEKVDERRWRAVTRKEEKKLGFTLNTDFRASDGRRAYVSVS